MIQSKKINIIITIAVVLALTLSFVMMTKVNLQAETSEEVGIELEYETEIFGTDIISIEIIADEDDWQEMLDNAANEEYIMVDVVINGTLFQNVGIRPKGNSSLNQVVNSDSDRYSFRIKFDEYIDGQTCFGLDSFVVNNMIGDNTYMKEYISYELMEEIGVDAPYFGFADITVNGEDWGFYLAVETYGDSYETRTFGTTSGMMYNVKGSDIGDNNEDNGFQQGNENLPIEGQGMQAPIEGQGMQPPMNGQNMEGMINGQGEVTQPNAQPDAIASNTTQPIQQNDAVQMERQRDNMGERGSSGGSLEYTTDDISSYSAIFGNVVGKGTDSDYQQVLTALEALSTGEELEEYFDVDQILRYLAAHTIVVNLDSYTSSMAQNYYLYENEGVVTILPWDYNLAWGGFQNESASSLINFPIDSPVSGVEMSSRPLINQLLSNTEYLEQYHSYLQELMTNYFADGQWEEKIAQLDSLISEYVENDNTAFATFEEYNTAVEAFTTLGNLRYQSIQGQLDGTVPSTTEAQEATPELLISAGDLDISSLGSMMGGGGNRGEGEDRAAMENNQQVGENLALNQTATMLDRELMIEATQILQEAGGMITEEVKLELLDIGLTEEQIEMLSQMGSGSLEMPNGTRQNPNSNDTNTILDRSNSSLPFEDQVTSSESTSGDLLSYSGLFTFVLLSAFFVSKKKRNY